MPEASHTFTAELWRHAGNAGWHFVTLPVDLADEISARSEGLRGGFGSVPVHVTVGATGWTTSVFPDRKSGSYLLPVKAQTREREGLQAGDRVRVALELRL